MIVVSLKPRPKRTRFRIAKVESFFIYIVFSNKSTQILTGI
jgi:hypothetical protein